MRGVKIGFVFTLCIVFLGTLVGGTGPEVEPTTSEEIADNYYAEFKARVKSNNSEKALVLLVDSLLEEDHIDPRVIKLLNSKIKSEFGEAWPIENEPYPAHDLYKSWNTLLPHPYKEDIVRGDSERTLCLTHKYMDCEYSHPFEGVVTSRFGMRSGKHHNGIDIDLVRGDTVNNVFRGVVRVAKWTGGYGRTVIVRHHNGLETIYAHLYRMFVKPGDVVDPGQPIGRGGNSGASRGSHLHFETRFKGKPINPETLIDFKNFKLLSDSLVLRKTRLGYVAFQPGTQFHKIKRGDFLYKIANQYGISVKQLCKWNGIRRNSVLIAGKELKVSE